MMVSAISLVKVIGKINKVAIAPGNDTVVSVGSEGAIFIWALAKPPVNEGKNDA